MPGGSRWPAPGRVPSSRAHGAALPSRVVLRDLRDVAAQVPETDDQLAALDDALQRLMVLDPRLCRVVELRHVAGLSIEETAAALALSPATVKRDSSTARACAMSQSG